MWQVIVVSFPPPKWIFGNVSIVYCVLQYCISMYMASTRNLLGSIFQALRHVNLEWIFCFLNADHPSKMYLLLQAGIVDEHGLLPGCYKYFFEQSMIFMNIFVLVFWRLRFIQILFTTVTPDIQRTMCNCFKDQSWDGVKEVIAIYFEYDTKHIKYVVWQNVKFCTIVAYGAYCYSGLWKVNEPITEIFTAMAKVHFYHRSSMCCQSRQKFLSCMHYSWSSKSGGIL